MTHGSSRGYGFPPLANPYVSDSIIAGSLSDLLVADLQAEGGRSATVHLKDTVARWTRDRVDVPGGGAPLAVGWHRLLSLESDVCAQLVEEVVALTAEANQRHLRIDCDRIMPADPPALLRFERNEFRSAMPDLDSTHLTRKLTVLVRLTPSDEVEGGLIGLEPGGLVDLDAGEVLVCPSFSYWGVTKVTRGRLVLLAVRLHGRPFR